MFHGRPSYLVYPEFHIIEIIVISGVRSFVAPYIWRVFYTVVSLAYRSMEGFRCWPTGDVGSIPDKRKTQGGSRCLRNIPPVEPKSFISVFRGKLCRWPIPAVQLCRRTGGSANWCDTRNHSDWPSFISANLVLPRKYILMSLSSSGRTRHSKRLSWGSIPCRFANSLPH